MTRLEVRAPGRAQLPGPIHNAAVLAATNPELPLEGLVGLVGANWADPATGRGRDRSRRARELRGSGLFDNGRIAWWVRSDAAELVDLCTGLLASRSGSVGALHSFVARTMDRRSVGRWADNRSVRGAESSSAVLDGAPILTARRSELADLVGAVGLVLLVRGEEAAARDMEAIGSALLWPLHRRHSERAAPHELAGSSLQSTVDDLTVLLGRAAGSAADADGSRRGSDGRSGRLMPTRSRAQRHATTLVVDLEALGAGLAGRSPLPFECTDAHPGASAAATADLSASAGAFAGAHAAVSAGASAGATRETQARRLGAALANLRGRSVLRTVRGEDVAQLDAAARSAPALIDVTPTLLRFCPPSSRPWEHALLQRLDGPSPYAGHARSGTP